MSITASSLSPCAACKFLRRKCTSECLFAPYFPPDQPQKFANVHKVFGASNVTKLLHELPPHQREDAVNSLAYEADARVKDPVYGCVGAISVLQQQVAHLQTELALAHTELARFHQQQPVLALPAGVELVTQPTAVEFDAGRLAAVAAGQAPAAMALAAGPAAQAPPLTPQQPASVS